MNIKEVYDVHAIISIWEETKL